MKVLRRIAVVGAAIASTLAGATAASAAHANACSTKVGTYMTIAHCGTTIDITYNRGTPLGHSEIWDYANPSIWANGQNTSWALGGVEQFRGFVDVRTCVEFWVPNGSGGWTRLNNEIDCSPA